MKALGHWLARFWTVVVPVIGIIVLVAFWTVELQPIAVALIAVVLAGTVLAAVQHAEVVASTLALGLGSTLAHDRLAAAVLAGGFDDATAHRAATVLLHFVLGHVSHEQQRMQYDSIGVLADPAPTLEDDGDPAAEFGFGVDLFVGGLELSRSRR